MPPHLLIDLGPGLVLTNLMADSQTLNGTIACLTASHSLRAAYEWLGVRAQVMAVQLAVLRKDGSSTVYGTESPGFGASSRAFSGHCLTYLPDRQRVCDLTVAQFPEIRRVDPTPVLGMTAMESSDGLRTFTAPEPGPLDEDHQFVVARKDLLLMYSFLGAHADQAVHTLMLREPISSADAMHMNLLNGLQAAAILIAMTIADPGLTEAAHSLTDVPRFGALVDALQGATWDGEQDEPDAFLLADGSRALMRELPLPDGVPGPLPQTAVKVLT